MAPAGVNPDLAREREKATFDVDQLTYFLYDGPANTQRKRYIQNAVLQEFAKYKLPPIVTLSQEGQYEQSLRRAGLGAQLQEKLGVKNAKDVYFFREAVSLNAPDPYGLHLGMFTNAIERLASEEQRAKWLPLVRSFRIVGTYAQTELGHGTHLRGLETTATYDPKTKEFVLHSPTITSAKYWPGGLGKTANCCLLMAQLITKGENHGMHAFVVQLRDLDTHQPLPGVTTGDLGAKIGLNSVDNGFLRLNHVRIPRTNMLMRYSQVLEDGTYLQPVNSRLTYGTMVTSRVAIVGNSARALAKAITIAVRYSSVRRQSEIQRGAGEVQVLDFQTQQVKLLPLVAAAYAWIIASRALAQVYQDVTQTIEKGSTEQLPQLHALSAGLKALSGWECSPGITQCGLACGGHGYSHASGIPKIYCNNLPVITYEGQNTVMMLQTARYLVKCYRSLKQGVPLPSLLAYLQLSSPSARSRLDTNLHLSHLVDMYQHRAARLIREVSETLEAAGRQGQQPDKAWNDHSVELVQAASAHCKAYVVKAFAETVTTMTGKMKDVMETLCQLYAVTGILDSLGDFLEDGYISSRQSSMIRQRLRDLLADLRPNAVALVDAFDFPDAILDSALGRWDGQVYPALYQWSLDSSMNKKQVLDAYYKYQRPFMEAQWAKNPQVSAIARL